MAADERTSRGPTPSGPNPKKIELTESLPGGWSERSEAARVDSRGRRRFSEAERAELLAALHESGQSVAHFSKERGLKASTVHSWLHVRRGASSSSRSSRRRRKRYTPEQRRATVEAFQRSGRPLP